jgi:uncharacterized protein involved in exopolysaccharide biosynthesis
VEDAEKALLAYREKEGLVDVDAPGSLVDQRLGSLNEAVLNARTERIAKATIADEMSRLPKTPGLSDLIVANCPASRAIQATRVERLEVLPCGYMMMRRAWLG